MRNEDSFMKNYVCSNKIIFNVHSFSGMWCLFTICLLTALIVLPVCAEPGKGKDICFVDREEKAVNGSKWQ